MATAVYRFPSNESGSLREVGGKAASLMQLSRFMPVPPGVVLSIHFFAPWWEELKATEEWRKFEQAEDDQLASSANQLKAVAMLCTFTGSQSEQLTEALMAFSPEDLFAVRSSSPEEDLEGTSFAGIYETVLGVTRKNVQAAIRACFASCLDYRIVAYKREHKLHAKEPKIAVVIQKQIASEIAGVAFSLNPVTNDFDEGVINANFGLGETVVAGAVTPDQFIVDKIGQRIKLRSLGTKERAVYLLPDGGTRVAEATAGDADRSCLSDKQILDVTRLLNAAESRLGKAADIEWAFEKGKLYLLQARPVTAYQPIPPELMTMPGRHRRLYLDITRSVQGIERPLSEMGASAIKRLLSVVSQFGIGVDITDHIDRTLPYVTAGRVYLNLSNALALLPLEKLLTKLKLADPLAADAIAQIDPQVYTALNSEIRGLPLMVLRRMGPRMATYLQARTHPEDLREKVIRDVEIYKQQLMFLRRSKLKLRDLIDRVMQLACHLVVTRLIFTLVAGLNARERLNKLIGAEFPAEFEAMTRSLPGNITVEMGLDLFTLSQLVPDGIDSLELTQQIRRRELPTEFMAGWDAFIGRYGHRAPEEFDIATRRFREDPSFLADQLVALASNVDPENTPKTKYDRAVSERMAAYKRVRQELDQRRLIDVIRLDTSYRIITALLGFRETPKYCIMLALDVIRQRILDVGAHLVSLGQLDAPDDAFLVSIEQLCAASEGSAVDLRATITANRARRARMRVDTIPKIFDSRGRIIRPPFKPQSDKELVGTPISPGTIRGIARILHSPSEKSLARGDILVAHATDPGWTPLFASASAVVLEVGGMLQHGALVAREYGLPCVAGIEGVTSLLEDGAEIEVDGTNGVVRIL